MTIDTKVGIFEPSLAQDIDKLKIESLVDKETKDNTPVRETFKDQTVTPNSYQD